MPATHAELIPPRFLFRFELSLHRAEPIWGDPAAPLDEAYQLIDLTSLDGQRTFADVRAAYSNSGLRVDVTVAGKHQPPWCRESRLEDSDGLQVWIDTRPAGNVHRATQFCHRFAFLPRGGGQRADQPVADQLLVSRARENARPVRPRELQVQANVREDGYHMRCLVSAACLTGFDPSQHQRIGLNYAVVDRELGVQTLTANRDVPYGEDPSLWPTVVLQNAVLRKASDA